MYLIISRLDVYLLIDVFFVSMFIRTLFVVYDSLKEKTNKQMEAVVSKSINMVATIYIMVSLYYPVQGTHFKESLGNL